MVVLETLTRVVTGRVLIGRTIALLKLLCVSPLNRMGEACDFLEWKGEIIPHCGEIVGGIFGHWEFGVLRRGFVWSGLWVAHCGYE